MCSFGVGMLLVGTAGCPEVDGSAAAAHPGILLLALHQELEPARREEHSFGTAAVAVEGLRAEGCIQLREGRENP